MTSSIPLAEIKTFWHAPWLVSSLYQIGAAHYRAGRPPDDALHMATAGDCLIFGVADGVSQSLHSDEGAQSALAVAFRHIKGHMLPGAPTIPLLVDAFSAAAQALRDLATERNINVLHFATTLSIAVVAPDIIVAASVGDSSIVIATPDLNEDGTMTISLAPFASGKQRRESNRPYTLSHDDWKQALATNEKHPDLVTAIILATDGADPFYIKGASQGQRETLNPELVAAFPTLLKTHFPPRKFFQVIGEHMYADEASDDDDRSLIIAFKPAPDLAPPFPVTPHLS